MCEQCEILEARVVTLEARIQGLRAQPLLAALERENVVLRRALDGDGAVFLERSDVSRIQKSFDVTPRQAEMIAVLYRAPSDDWINTRVILDLIEHPTSNSTMKTQAWHIRQRIGDGWIDSRAPFGYRLTQRCRERISKALAKSAAA